MCHRWEAGVFGLVWCRIMKDGETVQRTARRNGTEHEVGVEYTHVCRPGPSI
jgi:hypothetical protein